MYRIGIDIGGTFTDLVAVDDDGAVIFVKTPSTPQDQSIGVMAGLDDLAVELGTNLTDLLASTERIVHGMTVATNALLERKGAKVGLLTTEGHRDVLEMREGLKPERYNMRLARPKTLVPRHLRLGVKERMRTDGRVETPLDPASLDRAIETLKRQKVEAVAVCYLHAYADPSHEQQTGEALAKALPGVHVTLSSDVLPQIKEYERVSTTVVNAYVGPALSKYLDSLDQRLRNAGLTAPVLIILSHGGVAPIAEASRLAAATVLSGPAGGVAGSRHGAKLLDERNLIPFDMGGTSSDISLIVDGEPALSSQRGVAGERIALPSLDIVSIGAGGGSIARTDSGGLLMVGPESAGAVPGPACYGKGGTEATVTDASLVLGILDPVNFLGGKAQLDHPAANAAMDRLAATLKLDRAQAAEGIHRVINTQMAEGIRLVSVRRGVDPRNFALFAFGGAAGIHATDLARQLGINRVLVPRVASVLSAWGMLSTDLRYEVTRTHIGDASALDAASVRTLFDGMEAEGRARLDRGFDGPVQIRRSADMRYGEQIFEVDVPLDVVDWNSADVMAQIAECFHKRHEALFTYALRDQEAVLVNARVAVIGVLPAPPDEPRPEATKPTEPMARRPVYMGGWADTAIYDLGSLAPEQVVKGPAIVESKTTTVVLRPGDTATVTPQRWLDVFAG